MTQEEAQKVIKDSESIVTKRAGALRILFKYPEWKYLEDFINEQLRLREAKNAKKMSNQEQWLEHNFVAGEIGGLNLIKGLPSLINGLDESNKLMDEVNSRDLNKIVEGRQDNGK